MKKPELDLEGNPIKPIPKCEHCGKPRNHHRASDHACPFGKKDRTGGYSFPHGSKVQKFEPKRIFPFQDPSERLAEALEADEPIVYIRISNDLHEGLI